MCVFFLFCLVCDKVGCPKYACLKLGGWEYLTILDNEWPVRHVITIDETPLSRLFSKNLNQPFISDVTSKKKLSFGHDFKYDFTFQININFRGGRNNNKTIAIKTLKLTWSTFWFSRESLYYFSVFNSYRIR